MQLNYTKAQEEIFFPKSPKRFTIVSKGRRVGLTRGASQALTEYSLIRDYKILWGETIYSNVQRYIDLYFMPLLKQLPDNLYSWNIRLNQLRIAQSTIDFRSADNPDSWEGFGYDVIFINEAGIILKNPDLYKKTILPMLMDFPNSRLIAAGVPKGKKIRGGAIHPFYELYQKAQADSSNYHSFKLSSYDNPFLDVTTIKEIENALDSKIASQEIYGEFIDGTDNPYLYAFDSGTHTTKEFTPNIKEPIWFSFDFNIEPNSCIVGQLTSNKSGVIFDEISTNTSTEGVCDILLSRYPHWINRGLIFVTGDATGKNRNAMSGELTNYIIIKRKLNLKEFNLKVRTFNMQIKASRILCNAVLSKLDVRIKDSCHQTIMDCQIANVDAGGDLIKDSGLHKFDCFRYMVEAWFPDYLDKEYKYS